MNRGTIVLGTLQLVCIALLILVLTGGRTPEPPVREHAPSAVRFVETHAEVLDEARLRRVIQEELRRADGQTALPDLHIRDAAADRALRRSVEYQLAYYRGLDQMTPEEMLHLQGEIARLSPPDRTEMLRELTRALNSGEIKGFP